MQRIKLFVSLLASFSLLFPGVGFAQDADFTERELIDRRQNNYFYDINTTQDACYDPNVDGNFTSDLYFLGDSIGLGLETIGNLPEKIPEGWVSNFDNLEGRFLDNNSAQDGISTLSRDLENGGSATGARVVVIQLGTNNNGSPDQLKSEISETIDSIRGANPRASILWLDTPATLDTELYSGVNRVIREAASEENIDYYSLFDIAYPNGINGSATDITATSSNTLASTDGIHFTSAGYGLAADALGEYLSANYALENATGGLDGRILWPVDLDPEWIRIWTSVGQQYGVDPKILAAIFTSEHGGQFTPSTGDGGSAAEGGWQQPDSSTATGPFQFLNDAWDWVSSIDPSLPPRTNRGPSDPRNDPTLASRGAAVYLRFMGAPEGLPAGSVDQNFERASYGDSVANNESTRVAEVPWTVASVAVRYNQGPWWTPGTVQGNNRPIEYMQDSIDTYLLLGGANATIGLGSCLNQTLGTAIIVDGYAFPIAGTKAEVKSGYSWPCPGICHHDETPAFDLSHEYDDSSVGVPVYAITSGRIENFRTSYRGEDGCNSFQIVGDPDPDGGWWYWYGHTQAVQGIEAGRRVSAGEQVSVIGERRCTGNGSYPHLHIDRGSPQGRAGGSDCCRDQGFVPLINSLYEALPEE